MFVSETHLPQVLAPAYYLDGAVLEREIDRGFLPAWHLVAVSGELPVEGSFVTRSLLGREVILWRRSGRIRAFLNVCPHRFCAVTSRPSGCFTERLRCQHHGWEFDEEGLTRRIPDAPAFRPMEQLRLGLDEFPVATVADLVFVSLAAEPRPLEEFLGPAHALCAERCGGEWEHVWSWEPECPGNWKLANEITLEGYHAAETHASTLGRFPLPREEAMSHELPSADRCGLRVTYAQEDHPDIRASVRQLRLLGREPEFVYHHLHAFPHFGLIASDAYAVAQAIFPVTPTTHVNRYQMFVYRGRRRRGLGGRRRAAPCPGSRRLLVAGVRRGRRHDRRAPARDGLGAAPGRGARVATRGEGCPFPAVLPWSAQGRNRPDRSRGRRLDPGPSGPANLSAAAKISLPNLQCG
jgi:choline monooxygenase